MAFVFPGQGSQSGAQLGYFPAVEILTAEVFSILINLKLCNVLVMRKHIYIYIYIFASMKGMIEASWILLGLSAYVFFFVLSVSFSGVPHSFLPS